MSQAQSAFAVMDDTFNLHGPPYEGCLGSSIAAVSLQSWFALTVLLLAASRHRKATAAATEPLSRNEKRGRARTRRWQAQSNAVSKTTNSAITAQSRTVTLDSGYAGRAADDRKTGVKFGPRSTAGFQDGEPETGDRAPVHPPAASDAWPSASVFGIVERPSLQTVPTANRGKADPKATHVR